jgi:Lipocalin-like domain
MDNGEHFYLFPERQVHNSAEIADMITLNRHRRCGRSSKATRPDSDGRGKSKTPREHVRLCRNVYGDNEKVVHHVDISWNQSWTGTDLVRFYMLAGDTLTIRTARAENAFEGEEGEFVLVRNKVQ